jgi:hypothetical protein
MTNGEWQMANESASPALERAPFSRPMMCVLKKNYGICVTG